MPAIEPGEAIRADVWKGAGLVSAYLNDVRGGIPYGLDQIAIALRVASAFQPSVRHILDLGCGDGIVGAAARQIWPTADLTLLDFSQAMLKAAAARFAGETGVVVIEADFASPGWIERMPAAVPVDLVLSCYAIHHQDDDRKQTLYREIAGLLAPGGVFINIEHVSSPTATVAAINDELFIDTLEAHQRRLGSNESRNDIANRFYRRPDKVANRLALVEPQLAWLRDAGFVDVDCYFKVLELAVFGGRQPDELAA